MITELNGKRVFPIGIGTWHMGGDAFRASHDNDKTDVNAIKFAIKNGVNVIDTAELYGGGHAEELIAQAIAGKDREKLFIISKVHPMHLTYDKVIKAAEGSLRRLGTNYIDMYLIHWPVPGMDLHGTIKGMEELIDRGLIKSMGVSNFDTKDLEKAMEAAKKYEITANQVSYSLMKKDPEDYLIPFCARHKIKIIAYTPLGKGHVLKMREVVEMAQKYKKKPAQIALNYLMKKSIPIPKASNTEHIKEILGSVGWSISDEDYAKLSQIR